MSITNEQVKNSPAILHRQIAFVLSIQQATFSSLAHWSRKLLPIKGLYDLDDLFMIKNHLTKKVNIKESI